MKTYFYTLKTFFMPEHLKSKKSIIKNNLIFTDEIMGGIWISDFTITLVQVPKTRLLSIANVFPFLFF